METILVTGGTGTLGRCVVPRLSATGHNVRVLTRRPDLQPATGADHMVGDLSTGTGVDAAVEGVATIVHCAGASKGDDIATRHLVDAASRAGRPHVVYTSVVGAERMPIDGFLDRMMFGYFAMKQRAEEIVASSGLPWTTTRATQFHDLLFKVMRGMAKLPVMPIPSGVAFQPVETDEVAERLVQLALGQPQGLVPDVGGPEVHPMRELARSYLEATDRRRAIMRVPLPGSAAHALRSGANLTPGRAVGRRTWEQFLARHTAELLSSR
jgi:uncharacterized protein YbjT (DUF2867 family)